MVHREIVHDLCNSLMRFLVYKDVGGAFLMSVRFII